ncbi:TPA: BspA family leucine-rich repeat surface protein, partial [Acinetobacter baumannii]|nr:BspA family leucine-rich repeat surface protein [Acinetobacter baumannii]HEN9533316.1 BspA family leucine-rich repeat surface protein [Acinetobacter baumannii]HEN9568630.1 BspA family leucine-rich repeat surface protein [Acinetobacter baumannii]
QVDQSINVFPPKGYVSSVRIVRNYDVENGDIFKFRNDNTKEFKVVGGTITCPSQGVTTPVTEVVLGTVRDIFLKLDEGREFAYLAWKDKDRIMGVSSDDGSAFYGAIADYSLGLHAEDVVSINGICISSGSFNQRVNAWDVSEVTDAGFTFAEAINFNREINWYAPNIQWVNAFLLNAKKFNKDITIRGAKPKSMSSFLEGASSFNSKINVDTSECDNFSGMFMAASKFNQPINFNFGKAVSLNNFLSGAKEFNQPVDFGNMPLLTEAYYLFADSKMNSPIKFNAPNLT